MADDLLKGWHICWPVDAGHWETLSRHYAKCGTCGQVWNDIYIPQAVQELMEKFIQERSNGR